jgi:hypothetical protein
MKKTTKSVAAAALTAMEDIAGTDQPRGRGSSVGFFQWW